MNKKITKLTSCRICKHKNLEQIFNFGPTPLANAFLTAKERDLSEDYYPLEVYYCTNCSLMQLGHVVSAELLFENYVYVSSTSNVFIQHFEDFAKSVISRFQLKPPALIVDIGSNDGILLKPFKDMGYRVLGIEPAKKIASLANKNGIETFPEFFSSQVAQNIKKKYGVANIVAATNVFAHIDDIDAVVRAVKLFLSPEGIFIIEFPHLGVFINKNLFDTVYHEHLSYFALLPLKTFFERHDMEVFDAEKVVSHGGSLRVFVKIKGARHKQTNHVSTIINEEKKLGLTKLTTYQTFANRIQNNRAKLLLLLSRLKSRGAHIAGYGAPAKGNTLLNYFGVGPETLDFIIDDSPWKQGLFTPGKRIPVVAAKVLYEKIPDYLLILAWNFAASIIKNHARYEKLGGKFIIPVPSPKIVTIHAN